MTLWTGLAKHKALGSFPTGYASYIRTFFAPIDDVKGALLEVLGSAKSSFVASVFAYADSDVDMVVKAKANLPEFALSLDGNLTGGSAELTLLRAWDQTLFGTKIAVGLSSKHALAHLKFAVIDDLYTIRGSTNWTRSGMRSQENELTITRHAVLAAEAKAILLANHARMLPATGNYWPPPPTGTVGLELLEF